MKVSTKIAYGIGQVSEGVKTVAFNTLLFFYFNQVLGLSGSLAGMAAFLALTVDAVTDPMIGQISDRWHSRWGRRHPFMLAGAIPFGLAMAMLFSPPAGLAQWGLFGWMLGWSVAVRLMITLFYVPHLSLGAEMVKDYHQRTSLIGYRTFFSYFSGLLLSVIGFMVFFPPTEQFPNGLLNPASYPAFGILAGSAGTLAMLYCVFATRSSIPGLLKPAADQAYSNPLMALVTVFSTLRQQSFRVLFYTIVIVMSVAGMTQALMVYLASYIFGFAPEQLGLLAASLLIGILMASMVAQIFSRRMDKKRAFACCIFIGSIISFTPVMLYLIDTLKLLSANEKFMLVFLCNGVSQGFFIAAIILLDSMLTDTIDEHQMRCGRREEGLFFAAKSLAQKASFGLGVLFSGLALDVIEFPAGANPADVPAATLMGLAWLCGPLTVLFFMSSIISSWRYPINEQRHREIVAAIAAD